MSKLARIEAELSTLSPANFQKLGDAYLASFRSWRIQSWGTMVGADKDRTGVPDSWCRLPDDRYIFLAYTTADKDLPAKLRKDLEDCINRTKATITAAQVERICLVFNRRCSPKTDATLHELARLAGYQLELIGVDELAHYILDYPSLAAELINLDLGSGQLIHAPDFISIHERQVGTTHFTQTLFGRDTEQADLLTKLTSSDLVLVTGPAGVGKTQLVLTVAQAYCAQLPEQRQLYFVFDKKSPDFIQELQLALRPGQQLVVVADDANRVGPYFDTLLAEQLARPAGTLKIIATVRDYARNSVAKAANKTPYHTLEVQPLADEAIQALIAAEPYTIRNGDYVQRILQLSNGHPRLAIMAATAARETQSIYRLHNIHDIYAGYFGPILDELATHQNRLLGPVLALVHFFRVVHDDYAELAQSVEAAFGISHEQFWQAVYTLHEAELVDLHEGRIVKAADQILGSFVFYRIFLSEPATLSYAKLLTHFFPQQHNRIRDTLYGCINDFGIDTIRPRIQQPVKQWLAQPDLSAENRWNFYQVFWPFLTSQVLPEAAAQLSAQPWPVFEAGNYPVPERQNHAYLRENPLYTVLKRICENATPELSDALRLFIEFLAKHPDHFLKGLEFLRSIASFDAHQYRHQGLYVQEAVVKVLSIGARSALCAAFYQWLISHIVPPSLATVVHGTRPSHKPNAIIISNDELPKKGKALEVWRDSLWQLLFSLCPEHPNLVVEGISTYLKQRHNEASTNKWRKWDADRLIPFLSTNFDSTSFAHCRLVNHYSNWLEGRISHPGLTLLRQQFNSELFRLYKALTYDQPYRRHSERKIDIIYNGEKLSAHIRTLTQALQYKTYPPYTRLFDQYFQLHEQLAALPAHHPPEISQINNSIAELLHELIERAPIIASRVVSYLHEQGNSTGLTPWKTIRALAQQPNPKASYSLITQAEYRAKETWQLLFLKHLPPNQVAPHWLEELMHVHQSGIEHFNFYDLTHFESIAPTLYPDLLAISLETAVRNPKVHICYAVIERFGHHFTDQQLPLLKRYYQWWNSKESQYDWGCEELAVLVRREPGFLLEVFNFENDPANSYRYYERRPLTFLWQDDSYEEQISELLSASAQQTRLLSRSRLVKTIFPEGAGQEEKLRMIDFIKRTIESKPDVEVTKLLVKAVRESLSDQLMPTLELIFQAYPENPDQLFQHLSLIPSSRTAGSSWIPVFEADKAVWEQVLETIKRQPTQTFELMDYQRHALNRISHLNQQITKEAADNFADPY
ncbi:ATP-binding protein [Hymenobacter aerophilus]|uniref:ATP-binding protein n=1 Tax=Hymenobacter aerophilus TaxID=119644 RepID=UPI00036A0E85|nr:ATP-binding protein [Hymenobacter aerophilus]